MRARALAPVAALALALAGAAPAQADGPPSVRAKSGKRVVKALVVSYCWMDGTTGHCADGIYRHTEVALEWRPRAPLVFGTSARVDDLDACLMRVKGEGAVEPLGVCLALNRGTDGKWRGRMPKNLRGANSFHVHVRAGRNSADYAISVER